MESDAFQLKWEQIPTESKMDGHISTLASVESYEAKMLQRRLFNMASGEDETEVKFYNYCRYVDIYPNPR